MEYLYNGYFIAKDENDKYGVINFNGNQNIDFKYDVIQKIKNKNMIQALNLETKETIIYSSELKNICDLKNVSIDIQDEYLIVYNDDEKIFIDNSGYIISEDSDIVKDSKVQVLPSKIGDYDKIQYSLEDAYYMKK